MLGRPLAIVLLLTVTLVIPATGLAQVEAGPSGIHLAYGSDGAEAMTISWVGPPGAMAYAEVWPEGQAGEAQRVTARETQGPVGASSSYHAHVEDLSPSSTYDYRVVVGEERSEMATFTTAPAPGTPGTITITHFADHGTNHPANTRSDGEAPAENVALAASLSPDVHLVSGDTSYAEGDPVQWDLYLEMIEPLARTVPYMTVPGNHEREGTPATTGDVLGFANYDARFAMPEPSEEERWWQTQLGRTVIIGLNSETACAGDPGTSLAPGPGVSCQTSNQLEAQEDQLAFLEGVLSAASQDPGVDWIVVFLHHTLWSSAQHGSIALLQEHYGSVFDAYGVDVVLQGHDHVYERTHPIRGQTAQASGTVYLTNGQGGSGHYSWVEDPPWSAARDNEHYGTLVLELGEASIQGRYVGLDGSVHDRF
ncbi:MAG: metallophosphoesterase family protein, partial [Candidatus Thermoplasmatota archaeon]|nr:metallophosphoesterase family protein [Candidatus Thermoplasmatota archaeon]